MTLEICGGAGVPHCSIMKGRSHCSSPVHDYDTTTGFPRGRTRVAGPRGGGKALPWPGPCSREGERGCPSGKYAVCFILDWHSVPKHHGPFGKGGDTPQHPMSSGRLRHVSTPNRVMEGLFSMKHLHILIDLTRSLQV